MKQEDLEKITEGIQKKLGKEQAALINDDLANIVLDNTAMNTELNTRQEKINQLNQDKENLILTNNRLFQQVGIGQEEPKSNLAKKEDKKEKFSLKNVFDEKGNFIE